MNHIMIDRYNLRIDEDLVEFEEALDNIITTAKLLGYTIFYDIGNYAINNEEIKDSIDIHILKGEQRYAELDFLRNSELELVSMVKFESEGVGEHRKDYIELMKELLLEL